MDEEPEQPQPPAPPAAIPPLPPTPEFQRPPVPHVPLTPMMDFLQRRLESLEKELTLEREKARSAQGLIQQQAALSGEVEAQLKSLTDNLRREKAERESEETKSHARGRIDALEKRLDEMHQSFMSLLKDAIGQREAGAQAATASQAALIAAVNASQSEVSKEQASLSSGQAALKQEIAATTAAIIAWREKEQATHAAGQASLRQELTSGQLVLRQEIASISAAIGALMEKERASLSSGQASLKQELTSGQLSLRQEITALSGMINGVMEQVSQWRTESQGLGQLVPEVRALASQIPTDGRRLEGQLAQQLSQFSAELRDKMASWERRQELEAQKQNDRLEALSREKTALLRAWDEQNHELRQQSIKEKISRESEVAGLVAELARRMDELKLEQQRQARESVEINARIAKTLELLTLPPKAKDEMISALEREKSDFAKALRERSESLRRYALERGEIEKTMGETLLRMQGELEQEKKRELILSSRISDLELQGDSLKDRIASGERVVAERNERLAALIEERDRLVKSVVGEAERARLSLEERAKSDEAWAQRLTDLQKRLNEEIALRARESEIVGEVRGQIATLTDHMTRALQEKDAVAQRFSGWEAERHKLLSTLKEKDEMISMLNATFQNMLKK